MGYDGSDEYLLQCENTAKATTTAGQSVDNVPSAFTFAPTNNNVELPPHDEEHLSLESTVEEKPWRVALMRTSNFGKDDEDEFSVSSEKVDLEQGVVKVSTPVSSLPERETRVSFSHVQVREYAVTIGDHPFCSDWLPLTLDWKYNPHSDVYSIDEYFDFLDKKKEDEYDSDDYFSFRRHESPKRLFLMERLNRLKAVSGFTDRQLRRAQQERYSSYQQECLLEIEPSSTCAVEDKENVENTQTCVALESS